MANKKIKKTKSKHLYRNAAAPAPARAVRAVPRAVVMRPRGPIAADLEKEEDEQKHDTPGWGAFKAVGGALASGVAGAYLARQDWIPPKVMTGMISGLGALLALEGPEKWKSLGLGAMSAAGGQLAFMLIDDELIKQSEKTDKEVANKPAPPAPAKRQAGDIPSDALARAFERARLRMAIGHDGAS
jgi:hypothetical protein